LIEPRIESSTASDGYVWKYRRYDPVGAPRGEVVALHGIQSHGGWYNASSSFLGEHGWGVSFLDRRGSGLNEQARGDCPSFRRLLDDIAEFMRPLRQRTAGPVVLQSISWGGKLAVALQKRHPGLCDGLILVAPGLRPKVRLRLGKRLSIALTRMLNPTKLCPIPLTEPELFTGNLVRQQFIRDDTLSLRQATKRFLFGSGRLDIYLQLARRRVRVPVLLLLAGQDRIIDNFKTRRFVKRMRKAKTTVIEYPDAHHTLEFEANGPPHLDRLLSWLATIAGK
jgi:alpha-beta hydrolase superfamily lysophospholipase